MRVLYVIDSLARGGAESSLVAMAPGLISRGVDLDVAYLSENPALRPDLESVGARVFSLAPTDGRCARLHNVRAVARLVRAQRPDLVHTTLFEADVAGRPAARLVGVPVVSSLVNESYGPEHLDDPRVSWLKLRLAQSVDVVTARLARRMHAVSARVADVMAARLRYPRSRIDVIPRGRDRAVLGCRTAQRRAEARSALGLADDTPMVLAVARHEYQKGLDLLVRAAPHVLAARPTVVFAVAGREGSETATLEDLIGTLGIASSVRLLGARDDVADLLCAADLFVLPSRREGFPGSVVEAMALGTPIVATAIPTTREAVDDRSAWLVTPESADSLAETILGALADPGGAARRAAVAAARFDAHFSIDSVVDRMVAFYDTARRAAG